MVLGTVLFTVLPVAVSLFLSFSEWNFIAGFSREALTFVGLKNYSSYSR